MIKESHKVVVIVQAEGVEPSLTRPCRAPLHYARSHRLSDVPVFAQTFRHLRMLCFQLLQDRLDVRTSPFVASMLLGADPRAIERAMQLVGKGVELAFRFLDLAEATFALYVVVEVVVAVLDDVLRQFILVHLDCLHGASERIRTPNSN